jgi:hypothetical protein
MTDTAIAYTIHGAGKASGLGRTSLYEAIGAGKIEARKAGNRTLILADSLRAYIAGLPPADIRTGQRRSEPTSLLREDIRAGQQRAKTPDRRPEG